MAVADILLLSLIPGLVLLFLERRVTYFGAFYRVESSRGEHPGHGLGLSLVQAIAQYHYGSVELGNNNPGLQVRIELP